MLLETDALREGTDFLPNVRYIKENSVYRLVMSSGSSAVSFSAVVRACVLNSNEAAWLGVTASKKTLKKAVHRNRAKRRLKIAGRMVLEEIGKPSMAYVILARKTTITAEWNQLIKDIRIAIAKINKINT